MWPWSHFQGHMSISFQTRFWQCIFFGLLNIVPHPAWPSFPLVAFVFISNNVRTISIFIAIMHCFTKRHDANMWQWLCDLDPIFKVIWVYLSILDSDNAYSSACWISFPTPLAFLIGCIDTLIYMLHKRSKKKTKSRHCEQNLYCMLAWQNLATRIIGHYILMPWTHMGWENVTWRVGTYLFDYLPIWWYLKHQTFVFIWFTYLFDHIQRHIYTIPTFKNSTPFS